MNFYICWIVAILLVVSLQCGLSYFLAFDTIRIDFTLVFVLFAGMLHGKRHGMVVGFFTGLLIDILNIGLFGFYTVLFTLVGTVTGAIQKKVYEDSYTLPVFLVLGFTFGGQLIWNICLALGTNSLANIGSMLNIVFVKMIYNAVMVLPLLFIFVRTRRFFV